MPCSVYPTGTGLAGRARCFGVAFGGWPARAIVLLRCLRAHPDGAIATKAVRAATKKALLVIAGILARPHTRFSFAIIIASIKMTRETSFRLPKQISISTFEVTIRPLVLAIEAVLIFFLDFSCEQSYIWITLRSV